MTQAANAQDYMNCYADLVLLLPESFYLPKKQNMMKALMNQNDHSSLNKQILRSILELQALLNDYQLDQSPYDQDRTSEVQTAIDALDILTIRILNKQ